MSLLVNDAYQLLLLLPQSLYPHLLLFKDVLMLFDQVLRLGELLVQKSMRLKRKVLLVLGYLGEALVDLVGEFDDVLVLDLGLVLLLVPLVERAVH